MGRLHLVRGHSHRDLVFHRPDDRKQGHIHFGDDARRFSARIAALPGRAHHERKAILIQYHPKPRPGRLGELFKHHMVQRHSDSACAAPGARNRVLGGNQ